MGIAEAAIRKERTMKAVALADETDIVCSFIFKNVWRENNLDKICGQHSPQRIESTSNSKKRDGQISTSISERYLVEGRFRKLEKADPPFSHP